MHRTALEERRGNDYWEGLLGTKLWGLLGFSLSHTYIL